jgi:uncharacterized repeat protein (TIGR03803 family)
MQGQGCGFIYRVDPTGKATVLYDFLGQPDGSTPLPGLVLDSVGNAYGTTEYGGAYNQGTIFKLDMAGKETVLYSFVGSPHDGAQPYGNLARDSKGNLYGTTLMGGIGNCFGAGCGIVFKLDRTGKETVLYRFRGGADGGVPWAGLLLAGGTLYGTTNVGGNLDCQPPGNGAPGCGTVFKVAKNRETVLYKFSLARDGGFPVAGVIRDAAGNLYGTTEDGGDLNCQPNPTYGCGVVFKLDPSGNETVLHTFEGQQDGYLLHAGLVLDRGDLYGTTLIGGGIFQIDSSGNFAVMHPLTQSGTGPSTMIRDDQGNLYGTNGGEVFRFTP